MRNTAPSCFIEKEAISELQFTSLEVLENMDQKKLRTNQLMRALQLGNLLKNKVNIYFKDVEENLMRVNTTIWAVTNDAVVLKQGIYIPRNRVVFID
ncbi:hypothetical protein [Maribacter sp. 2210JD10-5]|uniref:hypothetical protein n=1 Tax=Maribacter sp. 2210JD10-5 TaxID=3386272 RepID=UPI0039BC89F8